MTGSSTSRTTFGEADLGAEEAPVALLHYSYAPIIGGVQTVMEQHAAVLLDHRHPVRVMAGAGGAVPDGVRYTEIPAMSSTPRETHPASRGPRNHLVRAIGPELRDVGTVVVHNLLTFHLNMPLLLALHDLMDRAPPTQRWIAWTHDLTVGNAEYRDAPRDAQAGSLLHTPHPRCRYVAVSTRRREEMAQGLGLDPRAIRVVPNPVDPFAAAGASPRLRALARQRGWIRAWPLLLYPARVVPRKRVDLAVRSVAALARSYPDAHLVVTGSANPHLPGSDEAYGAAAAAVRELAVPERVTFVGDTFEAAYAEVMSLYHICDVLLFTTRSEGFGIPVLEAALARMPIACTDIEPLTEILPDGAARFPANADAAEIASCVDRLVSDRADLAAAREVRSSYAPEAIYRRHLLPLIRGTK